MSTLLNLVIKENVVAKIYFEDSEPKEKLFRPGKYQFRGSVDEQGKFVGYQDNSKGFHVFPEGKVEPECPDCHQNIGWCECVDF